jgi:4-amino-4-deoxy-L-arabinose transferase-like glycosyltransferase
MHFLQKFKAEILAGLFIGVLYFIVRLPNLTNLPVFTDEAIYLRWAQIALNDANWRFISLTDGKQPSFVWAVMIFMRLFDDPVLAGRLVSVVTGFFTMIGLWLVTYQLFKNKVASFFASLLFIFYPLAQVHDRMAIYDSMVATFAIWALYFSILFVRTLRLDVAYTLGFIIGGAVLTKSSGFFSAALLPFTLLLFDIKKPQVGKRFLRWILFAIFALIISQLLYSILRLSPFFGIINEKNATFVYPLAEWIKQPFTYFVSNNMSLWRWVFQYMHISYITLIVFGIATIHTFFREKALLILYFFAPFFYLSLFGIAIFPRFIYFMTIMLLPIAAWSLAYILELLLKKFSFKRKSVEAYAVTFVVVLLAVGYQAYTSFMFILNPITAPIAKSDSIQYVNNWTAGWGVERAVEYLEQEADDKKIFVATQGTFGLMPYALELYLVSHPNMTIRGYWPIAAESLPEEVLIKANAMPTYFIFYQPQADGHLQNYPLELVFEEQMGASQYYFRLFKVKPN